MSVLKIPSHQAYWNCHSCRARYRIDLTSMCPCTFPRLFLLAIAACLLLLLLTYHCTCIVACIRMPSNQSDILYDSYLNHRWPSLVKKHPRDHSNTQRTKEPKLNIMNLKMNLKMSSSEHQTLYLLTRVIVFLLYSQPRRSVLSFESRPKSKARQPSCLCLSVYKGLILY
jgi:hypothetical protein